MPALTHQETRALIAKYRARAQEFCAEASEMDHGLPLSTSPRANVQLAEDGAFVECVLWIPKGDL